MGEMADFDLEEVCTFENLRDDFAMGSMSQEDAFENGFLDASGVETDFAGKPEDRVYIPCAENLEAKLADSIGVLESTVKHYGLPSKKKFVIHENPTCNVCKDEMLPRDGRYGKFYYCGNYCSGQKAVSDKYWQSYKAKRNK